MKIFLNTIAGGILSGVLGTFFGFLILGAYWSYANAVDLSYFIENIAAKSLFYRDSILTISTLFNVGVFYIGIKAEWWKFCRGILMVIMACVPLIIWFQMQAGIS
jgi:hypothetical protein